MLLSRFRLTSDTGVRSATAEIAELEGGIWHPQLSISAQLLDQ